jgi:hypothetical protein
MVPNHGFQLSLRFGLRQEMRSMGKVNEREQDLMSDWKRVVRQFRFRPRETVSAEEGKLTVADSTDRMSRRAMKAV